METRDLLAALADGPLTLDALSARLGAPEREGLRWALDDAVQAGTVTQAGGVCDEAGICASGAPAVFALSRQPLTAGGPPPASQRGAARRAQG